MDTWKILLITLLSAAVIGCIIGVFAGKHQLKKARGEYKPLLTVNERCVYLACIIVGAAFVLIGVFRPFSSEEGMEMGMDGAIVMDDYGEGDEENFQEDLMVNGQMDFNEEDAEDPGSEAGDPEPPDTEDGDGGAGDTEDLVGDDNDNPTTAGEEDATGDDTETGTTQAASSTNRSTRSATRSSAGTQEVTVYVRG